MLKKLIFILVPLILIGSHLGQRIKNWYQVKQELAELHENINHLEEEQQTLMEKKEFYQTEEFIRREAREKLGLTREEDLIVILPEIPDLSNKSSGIAFSPNLPVWKQWWNVFFIDK